MPRKSVKAMSAEPETPLRRSARLKTPAPVAPIPEVDSAAESDSSSSSSSSSSSDSGSDFSADYLDEDEISEWLTHPDRERTTAWGTSTFRPPSPRSASSWLGTPAALALQVIHFVLYLFDLGPNSSSHIPTPTQLPTPPPATLNEQPNQHNRYRRYPKHLKLMYEGTPYFLEDDAEYILPPARGTDEPVMRIPLTEDLSAENLKLQEKDALRIYRVPWGDKQFFSFVSSGLGMIGHDIRKPVDFDDTISVVRHGHVCMNWKRDEVLMLMGGSYDLRWTIAKLVPRADRRKPPYWTRMKQFFRRTTFEFFEPVMFWLNYTRLKFQPKPKVRNDDAFVPETYHLPASYTARL
ncbi:hypothetical protein M413DRAFT_441606 [Hebeloma cylindrosporum]|uniref:Uncharacterized protein n=1 Tax=Hebeloma cylindrosporum TaxID=76867 RepID=A0A0C2YZV9_HEBCY|nr:hypothetical protein M413DRAFT_441606 [Hebeloma cylindrosporum h7]